MYKRAIILAGGKGTRLLPYTVVLPKPLMPIGEYPILEVIVKQLVSFGFNHITLAVNHQAELLQAFFGDGSKWGIKIDYSLESIPLSTMGPLKIAHDLPDNFLIMNGDVLTDLNFSTLFDEHVSSDVIFTISATKRENVNEYGVLECTANNILCNFKEKPVSHFLVSMGIYMANKKILDHIPANKPFGFDNLMLHLLKSNISVIVKEYKGYWLDIGRADDYVKAIEIFETNKKQFLK